MKYTGPYELIKKDGDNGWDLRATEDVVIRPQETVTIDTGVSFEFGLDIFALVVPRSGLSSKGILCSVGLVDTSYRGKIGVNLTNTSKDTYRVNKDDRIGQLVFYREIKVYPCKVDRIDSDTERGTKGFGSSGR